MSFRIGERVELTESLTFADKLVRAGTMGIVKARASGDIYEVDFEDHPHPIPVHESSLAGYKGLEGKSGTDSGGKPPAFGGLEGKTGTPSGGKPPPRGNIGGGGIF